MDKHPDSDALLKSVSSRINQLTRKGDGGVTQPRMPLRGSLKSNTNTADHGDSVSQSNVHYHTSNTGNPLKAEDNDSAKGTSISMGPNLDESAPKGDQVRVSSLAGKISIRQAGDHKNATGTFTSYGKLSKMTTVNPNININRDEDELFWSSTNAQFPKPMESVWNANGATFIAADNPMCNSNATGPEDTFVKMDKPNELISCSPTVHSVDVNLSPTTYAGAARAIQKVFEDDGISLIATYLGRPIMLDSFTSDMFKDSWGRSSFARCLIEINSDAELKDTITIGIPDLDGFQVGKEFAFQPRASNDDGRNDKNSKQSSVNNNADNSFVKKDKKQVKDVVDKGVMKMSNITSPNPFDALGDDDDEDDVENIWDESENLNLKKIRGNHSCWYVMVGNGPLMGVYVLRIITRTDNKTLFCSFIYADNYYVDRCALWDNLAGHAYLMRDKPWALLGDFNATLNLEDHSCGGYVPSIAMCEFKECVQKMKVMDVNATDLHFTWTEKPKGANGVLKKIDRIMCNIPFNDCFLGSFAIFQPYRISDHSPCVLRIPKVGKPKPKTFKIYNFLVYKEGFRSVFDNGWTIQVNGCAMYRVVKRLKGLKTPLQKLLHNQGNLHNRVNRLWLELDEAQKATDRNPTCSSLREEHAHYLLAFKEAALDEERFLRQKSKVEWLKAGDSNSAYFYHIVKSKCMRNRIEMVRDSANILHEGNDVAVLDSHKAAFMIREVSNAEIKNALFSMGDDKAPGPDGFTTAFLKKAWDTVGKDVTGAIKEFFMNCRRISDNILLTQELMRNYHRKRGPSRCAFKVDIQKAYDTVDWGFLRTILIGFGFHSTMVEWIMTCMTTTSYSICINGNIHGWFKRKRSLRQGDPLSPYLFTIVMEVLTLIMQHDLFLFSRGHPNSVQVIMDALGEFKNVSGLVSSILKSIGFFCNVSSALKGSILSLTPFAEDTLHVCYLGVSLISSRLLYRDCKILVEKLESRVNDWRNKFLSFANRLQLIRSVLSSMHIYWALVFILPMRIIHDLEQLMRGFLWCHCDIKKSKDKVAWESICKPKSEGGLNIRRIKDFNISLMATHIWFLMTCKLIGSILINFGAGASGMSRVWEIHDELTKDAPSRPLTTHGLQMQNNIMHDGRHQVYIS
ncbi:uncharacterized protein Tco_0099429 [Tanacetum coccineum]